MPQTVKIHATRMQRPPGAARRRVIAALLVCALCCALLSSAAATQKTVVTNASVNLRSGPGTRHTSLIVIKENTELTVTGSSGDWYKVTYGKRSGFVRKDLVSEKSASDTPGTGSAAAPTTYRTLREGMSGDDVFRLQEALANAGFYDLMPDGKYGRGTTTAVTNY